MTKKYDPAIADKLRIQAQEVDHEFCDYLVAFLNTSTDQPTDHDFGSKVPRTMAARALGAADARKRYPHGVGAEAGCVGPFVMTSKELQARLDEMCGPRQKP